MMKTKLLPLLLSIFILSGCSTILPNNDPVVVRAEQTIAASSDTFDLFLHLVYDNKPLIEAKAPSVLAYAQYIATNGKLWINSAQTLKSAYKNSKTASNKDALIVSTSVLLTALTEVQKYIVQTSTLTK